MTEYCESCLLDILPFIAPIFEFGLKGISFRHSDANVSTILFFYRLFGYFSFSFYLFIFKKIFKKKKKN